MNRNVMYEYLESIGMKPLFMRYDKNRYYTKFVLDDDTQADCRLLITTDWGYIRRCNTINLCADEMVIESECYYGGTAKINIRYSKIEKFEVEIRDKE